MEDENRLWTLFTRKLAGEASPDELKELEELLKRYPQFSFPLDTIAGWWRRESAETATDAGKIPSSQAKRSELDRRVEHIIELDRKARLDQRSAFEQKDEPGWLQRPLRDLAMLRNYFKIGWRNLVRGGVFSVVNISGLAIGMASAILILLWVQNELSIDRFHQNKDRAYLAFSQAKFDNQVETWDGTSMRLGPALEAEYPEVETTARANFVSAFVFHANENHLQAQGFLTDSTFLSIFDFPLLQGNAKTALNSPRSLVITEKFAKQLFGSTDAMGKTVRIDSSDNFIVTGILKDLPNNTQFRFHYLAPWSYMKEVHWERDNWGSYDIQTFVLLKPGAKAASLNASIKNIVNRYASDVERETFLYPMEKWWLWSRFENGKVAGGRIATVRLFAVTAAFILLIACINYMNLTTSRSITRAKEVGIRKVTGAGKRSLVFQFLGESIMVAMIAGVLAMVIVQPSLGWFNNLTGKELFIPYQEPVFWMACAGFILFTGVLAGSYPAFYLSAYRPIQVLKGTFKNIHALVTPRKVMVVFQFTIAIAFIICTIVIHNQIRHGLSRDAGFNRQNLIFVFMKGNLREDYAAIRHEMISSGAVTSITRTNSPITSVWNGSGSYEWPGKDPGREVGFHIYHTDADFAKTMGLRVIRGRDINIEKFPGDSNSILINETAARIMKFEDPIGQLVKSDEGNWKIIGVINDFIPGSPFGRAEPLIVQGPGPHHWYGTISFTLNMNHSTGDNLATIGTILKKHNPDYPFDYYFADESHAIKFSEEKKTQALARIFTALTIIISCLGLFALAAYTAETRMKEVGVRKVLGASILGITSLLSKDFLKLVFISFVIASPLAWWAMNSWLEHYAYRVSIGWQVFVLTGIMSTVIAMITVSYQAVRTAMANPVRSLRSE